MTAVYTDETALKEFLGADLVDSLGGLEGSLSTSVISRAISDASREIDAALAVIYAVPFGDYSAGETPDIIHVLANHLAAANLLAKRYPETPVYQRMRELADTIMARLASGEYEVPSGAAEEDAADAGQGVAWSGVSATFANDGMGKW